MLTYGPEPKVDINAWQIRVFGLVEREITLDWQGFTSLSWRVLDADFHCVTQWSALDQTWEGVALTDLLAPAGVSPKSSFIMAHCFGGYSTNVPLDLALAEGFLAHKQGGQPLGKSHGWPLRLIVPSLYGWKSAKWVSGIELMAEDAPRFLGAARLSQQRRSVEGRTLLAGVDSLAPDPANFREKREGRPIGRPYSSGRCFSRYGYAAMGSSSLSLDQTGATGLGLATAVGLLATSHISPHWRQLRKFP